MHKKLIIIGTFLCLSISSPAQAAVSIDNFNARVPIHVYSQGNLIPTGLSPDQVKLAYHLPTTGGSGTIAIIAAYSDQTIEKDLNIFSRQFGLPDCTTVNGCLEIHKMSPTTGHDSGWALETSLDVEWAHAIAPKAKILLMQASTASGRRLMEAVDYARTRRDLVAISMSWGGPEFADEVNMEDHFTSPYGATFFASSGDNGWGVSWPASSKNVVAVGGTRLNFSAAGRFSSETAWSGSGGGVSAYLPQPDFQSQYNISRAHGHRAIPDVSYNADPASGFSVYSSSPGSAAKSGWYVLGGTSAGAPQWAAIKSLGLSAGNAKFYQDKSGPNNKNYFRDIISGANGDCKYYCEARKRYDYVTGLGSPLTANY
ncbi:S53 family peptidase [Candidatus Uhrbacteria bacterium]|nr:S53 family peptidase [Candidatus Uhrbacteria bacterium]